MNFPGAEPQGQYGPLSPTLSPSEGERGIVGRSFGSAHGEASSRSLPFLNSTAVGLGRGAQTRRQMKAGAASRRDGLLSPPLSSKGGEGDRFAGWWQCQDAHAGFDSHFQNLPSGCRIGYYLALQRHFAKGCQSSSGVEQRTHKPLVGGSNPSSGTNLKVKGSALAKGPGGAK